jgi:hypothetical protein
VAGLEPVVADLEPADLEPEDLEPVSLVMGAVAAETDRLGMVLVESLSFPVVVHPVWIA